MGHGGMLARARVLFPHAPATFVDLSTGINPVAYKLAPFPQEALTLLPDEADLTRLERVAAQAFGVPDPACVLAGPGTQIFISLLPTLLRRPAASVAVLSPTYGEHAQSWVRSGCTVAATADFDALAEADIAVLCQPNNPDGRVLPRATLWTLADRMAARDGVLVVDEAFMDLEDPANSLADLVGHPALLILRSFGKWSGLAGLRLGFVLSRPDWIATWRASLGPWAVSGPGLFAGLQALPDDAWRAESIARLDRDGARLDALLARAGMELVGGTRLFRLYHGEVAQSLWQRLGDAGILTRRFDLNPAWLRFGLPGKEADWARLDALLSYVC
jgi:cobalamin biosynthetic protein CobC